MYIRFQDTGRELHKRVAEVYHAAAGNGLDKQPIAHSIVVCRLIADLEASKPIPQHGDAPEVCVLTFLNKLLVVRLERAML